MNIEYRYPDGEELEKLIAAVENGEMLKAPSYLKENIIRKTKPCGEQQEMTLWDRKEGKCQMSARARLFIYSTKIVAGVAAAVLCLAVLPAGMNRNTVLPDYSVRERRIEQDMAQYRKDNSEKGKNDITAVVNEKTDELCRKLNDFSNMFIMEERDYD